jgi:hypothetical protein
MSSTPPHPKPANFTFDVVGDRKMSRTPPPSSVNTDIVMACSDDCNCDGATPSAFVLSGQSVYKYHATRNGYSQRFLQYSRHILHWNPRLSGAENIMETHPTRYAHIGELVGVYRGKYLDRFETNVAHTRATNERAMTVVLWSNNTMHMVDFECHDMISRDRWVDDVNMMVRRYYSHRRINNFALSIGGQLIQQHMRAGQHDYMQLPHFLSPESTLKRQYVNMVEGDNADSMSCTHASRRATVVCGEDRGVTSADHNALSIVLGAGELHFMSDVYC